MNCVKKTGNEDQAISLQDQAVISKNRSPHRKYSQITFDRRLQMLKDILHNQIPIKEAAKKHQIKLSTAKVILKVYRNEGRIGKMEVPTLSEAESKNEKNRIQEELKKKEQDPLVPKTECEKHYFVVCQQLTAKLNQLKAINFSLQQTLWAMPMYQMNFNI